MKRPTAQSEAQKTHYRYHSSYILTHATIVPWIVERPGFPAQAENKWFLTLFPTPFLQLPPGFPHLEQQVVAPFH